MLHSSAFPVEGIVSGACECAVVTSEGGARCLALAELGEDARGAQGGGLGHHRGLQLMPELLSEEWRVNNVV